MAEYRTPEESRAALQELSVSIPGLNTPEGQHALGVFAGNRADSDGRVPVQDILDNFKQQASQFAALYQNYIGTPPSNEAYGRFFGQVAGGHDWYSGKDPDKTEEAFRDRTLQFISDNFQKEAQEAVTEQLQAQEPLYKDFASTFLGKEREAINQYEQQAQGMLPGIEAELKRYQNELFDQLKPQLVTRLQSMGLLNTGALNTAFSGAAKDLSNTAQETLLQARMGIGSDVAAQRLEAARRALAIESGSKELPLTYERQNLLSRLPQLQSMGQSALANTFQRNMAEIGRLNQDYFLQQQPKQDVAALMGGQIIGNLLGSTISSGLGKLGGMGKKGGATSSGYSSSGEATA